ncbi:helix-turn-helix domain-containing protein [Methylorubrum extorquens]|uniref:Transcriptional regulator, Crp/Fnr family n=1 Tax=Methylorubrum extorquens (strain CM4 / NCIMB 13688) TaxID=440085 RepID=B7KUH7_METC4|nr:helix-turn-helix domain-containing protein [Methylorubrum extorquens]ACK84206.1 transcriptional regulator, Crp/Fnr family [Methylorubrum extorquens CM4]
MMSLDQQPSVLLTEEVPLVGMDLSDTLEQAGYRVLGPAATASQALSLLEQETPALAVIDIMLKDGPCTELARELRRRGVAFLVHSGCYQDEPLASEFLGVPWISKPAPPDDVVSVLGELLLTTASTRQDAAAATPLRLVEQSTARGNPLIRKLERFAMLSEADRALLEQISASPRTVPAGTDLVREGDEPDGVFLVLSGFACRHKMRANGARQINAYLLPGDLCDLDVALLDEMDHTITTLSVCKVVLLAPEVIANLLSHHPQIARALRKSTLVDEATLREWLINIGRRSTIERLAHLFCEVLLRLRAVGLADETSYELPLTQVDLADTTGTTSIHVNRSLRELRQRGLIELEGGRLTILDYARLRALAEFRANYLHLRDRAAA